MHGNRPLTTSFPTELRAELPAGFRAAGDVSYPQGELHTFCVHQDAVERFIKIQWCFAFR